MERPLSTDECSLFSGWRRADITEGRRRFRARVEKIADSVSKEEMDREKRGIGEDISCVVLSLE